MGLHSLFENLLDRDDSLERVESAIWESLAAAAKSNRHGWHFGWFNTASVSQQSVASVNSRTVILRSVDRTNRTVDCHTDVRSQKVSDLAACSTASWTFYDPKSKMQLRLGGEAVVIDDARTDEAWQQTSLASRSAYLSVAAPATEVQSANPPSTDDRKVSLAESERGREHFRIVRLNVAAVDWLYLRREGHLRVKVKYSDGQDAAVRWLVP